MCSFVILRRERSAVFNMVWPLTPQSAGASFGIRTHPCPNKHPIGTSSPWTAQLNPYVLWPVSRSPISGVTNKGLTTQYASIDRRIQSRTPRQTPTESCQDVRSLSHDRSRTPRTRATHHYVVHACVKAERKGTASRQASPDLFNPG
jgi:hypothetical protein